MSHSSGQRWFVKADKPCWGLQLCMNFSDKHCIREMPNTAETLAWAQQIRANVGPHRLHRAVNYSHDVHPLAVKNSGF